MAEPAKTKSLLILPVPETEFYSRAGVTFPKHEGAAAGGCEVAGVGGGAKRFSCGHFTQVSRPLWAAHASLSVAASMGSALPVSASSRHNTEFLGILDNKV